MQTKCNENVTVSMKFEKAKIFATFVFIKLRYF